MIKDLAVVLSSRLTSDIRVLEYTAFFASLASLVNAISLCQEVLFSIAGEQAFKSRDSWLFPGRIENNCSSKNKAVTDNESGRNKDMSVSREGRGVQGWGGWKAEENGIDLDASTGVLTPPIPLSNKDLTNYHTIPLYLERLASHLMQINKMCKMWCHLLLLSSNNDVVVVVVRNGQCKSAMLKKRY